MDQREAIRRPCQGQRALRAALNSASRHALQPAAARLLTLLLLCGACSVDVQGSRGGGDESPPAPDVSNESEHAAPAEEPEITTDAGSVEGTPPLPVQAPDGAAHLPAEDADAAAPPPDEAGVQQPTDAAAPTPDTGAGDEPLPWTLDEVLGYYRRDPVENDWHLGRIERKKGGLRWINAAGRAWRLYDALDEGLLRTDEDCPYYGKPGGDAFEFLRDDRGQVAFRFLGVLTYRLVGSEGDGPPRGALPQF